MTIEGEVVHTRKSLKHYRLAFKEGHTMVRIWIPNNQYERIIAAKESKRLSWWKAVLIGLGLREFREGSLFPTEITAPKKHGRGRPIGTSWKMPDKEWPFT